MGRNWEEFLYSIQLNSHFVALFRQVNAIFAFFGRTICVCAGNAGTEQCRVCWWAKACYCNLATHLMAKSMKTVLKFYLFIFAFICFLGFYIFFFVKSYNKIFISDRYDDDCEKYFIGLLVYLVKGPLWLPSIYVFPKNYGILLNSAQKVLNI